MGRATDNHEVTELFPEVGLVRGLLDATGAGVIASSGFIGAVALQEVSGISAVIAHGCCHSARGRLFLIMARHLEEPESWLEGS